MARTDITPISQLGRRAPEQGRLRTGVKTNNPKRPMEAIDTWRFTSADREALDTLAGLYGGTVRPWEGSPRQGEYELISEANEIRVAFPPDPLGGTPIYEMWSAGGCQRRCDGAECLVPRQTGPDTADMVAEPCLCEAAGKLSCDVKTRLNVVLPEVRFGGTWRFESKSWNFAKEAPGMIEIIQNMQVRGFTYALLAIENRVTKVFNPKKGKIETHHYKVPVPRLPESLETLAAGGGTIGVIPSGERQLAALPAGPGVAPSPGPGSAVVDVASFDLDDDEPVDVEVVEPGDRVAPAGGGGSTGVPSAAPDFPLAGDEPATADQPMDRAGGAPPGTPDSGEGPAGVATATVVNDSDSPAEAPFTEGTPEDHERQHRRIHALFRDCGLSDDDIRHAFAMTASRGRSASTKDLTVEDQRVLIAVLEDVKRGDSEFVDVNDAGWARLRRKP